MLRKVSLKKLQNSCQNRVGQQKALGGKGKTLVVTTQVAHEGSDMDVYRVGRGLKKRFDLLESYAMTYESIMTKLMWVLAQTNKDEEIRHLFYQPINYDLIG